MRQIFNKKFIMIVCVIMSVLILFSSSNIPLIYGTDENNSYINEGNGAINDNYTDINEDNTDTNEKADNKNVLLNYKNYGEAVAQNDHFAIYIDSINGYISIIDKKDSKVYSSTPANIKEHSELKGISKFEVQSVLLVEYTEGFSESKVLATDFLCSYADCVSYGMWETKAIDNGVRIEYTFEDHGFLIPVEVVLEEDCFKAYVCLDEIQETGDNLIISLSLLPYMVSGDTNDDGYLFIPQGCGALMHFENKDRAATSYSMPIYGNDISVDNEIEKQTVSFPVFGACYSDKAILGVISSGDAQCNIAAEGADDNNKYSTVYPNHIYRASDDLILFEGDSANERIVYSLSEPDKKVKRFEITYIPKGKKGSSYVDLAETYRNYLLKTEDLRKYDTVPKISLDVYGAIKKQTSFLGVPYQKEVALTEFDDAVRIISDLNKSGIKGISLKYNGWTNSGVRNEEIAVNSTPLSVLGGKKAFNRLLETAEKTDTDIVLTVDLMHFNESAYGISTLKDSVRNLFNVRQEHKTYKLSTLEENNSIKSHYLLRADIMLKAADKQINNLNKYKNVSVNLTGIASKLYSDYASNETLTRYSSIGLYRDLFKKYENRGYSVTVDGMNSYAWKHASRIYGIGSVADNYIALDEAVPFSAIVLHGYIPYTASPMNRTLDIDKYLLYCLETGSDPYYMIIGKDASILNNSSYTYLYSTEYSVYADDIKNTYLKYHQVYSDLHDKTIVGHESLNRDVYKTVYSDGTLILVNYGEQSFTFGGKAVNPMDYLVIKK